MYDPAVALVEPARLVWGLRQACLDLGVRIHEGSPVVVAGARRRPAWRSAPRGPRSDGSRVVLGTNASRPLLRRLRLMCVPVHDYTVVTEPLDAEQREAIGWAGREGVGDASNLFHYYRLTRDDRLLFGGYDAVYHYGSRSGPDTEHRDATYRAAGAAPAARRSRSWPACASATRGAGSSTPAPASAASGARPCAAGWPTRWGSPASVSQRPASRPTPPWTSSTASETERTALQMVREKPLPFPPEPLRWAGIEATRRSMERADRTGRDNLWLKTMDKLGLGFDS